MNLDRKRIYINCPHCNFIARIFLRQVRHQDVIVCGGCKGNVQLKDHMGRLRKAQRQLEQMLSKLEQAMGKIGGKLRR